MTNTRKLIYSAICLAIGLLLPQVFHMFSVANAGSVFCPMHLPVLLCGFLCGWIWGGAVGILVPLLSSLITGMPPAPMNVSMRCWSCAPMVLWPACSIRSRKRRCFSPWFWPCWAAASFWVLPIP